MELKSHRQILYVLTAALLLSSCGELFDWETGELETVNDVYFNDASLTMMEGDSIKMQVHVRPDGVEPALFFSSDDSEVASIVADTLAALSVGETMIRVSAPQVALEDSMSLTVIPTWWVDASRYEYDMIVYASVDIAGKVNNPRSGIVGAFCGEELRGVGVVMYQNGRAYTRLRIYSHKADGEIITFRCYRYGLARIDKFEAELAFDAAMSAVGSLSNPYRLTLGE